MKTKRSAQSRMNVMMESWDHEILKLSIVEQFAQPNSGILHEGNHEESDVVGLDNGDAWAGAGTGVGR